jgi:hypothetical protein
MKTFNTTLRTLATGATLALLATGTALADPSYYGNGYKGGSYVRSTEFRFDNPVKIFVNVDIRDRSSRREDRFETVTEQAMRANMPNYIRIVDNPRYADIVIDVREEDYDLDRRIVDRDREDDRYGRLSMHASNHCGPAYKASYTVVKERLDTKARYTVHVTTEGVGRERERITARADSYLTYGEDLRAHNRCGAEPTNRFPNQHVAALFDNASGAGFNRATNQIRRETAADLGRKLAGEIRSNVDDYYASLAVRYAHGGHYGNPGKGHGKHKTSHGRWD